MIRLGAIRHPFLASEAKAGGFSQNALLLAERISVKTSWRKLPDMIHKGALLDINMPRLRLVMAQAILDSPEAKKSIANERTINVSKFDLAWGNYTDPDSRSPVRLFDGITAFYIGKLRIPIEYVVEFNRAD